MLLMTNNSKKYHPIKNLLINIGILPVSFPKFKELQSENAREAIRFKADQVKNIYSGNFIVDDTILILKRYGNFPGSYTNFVLKTLKKEGLSRLTDRGEAAEMVCRMGGYYNGEFIYADCHIGGRFDPTLPITDESMKLSSWFVSDKAYAYPFPHRIGAAKRIMDSLKKEVIDCELMKNCIFCEELRTPDTSVYKDIVGNSLPANRIIKETDSFILMPPLGEFVEGGLLVMTKTHIISMAWLDDAQFAELCYLIEQLKKMARAIWNKPLLIFEHGPYTASSKSCSCVAHAHLNIFPVSVDVHSDLDHMFNIKLDCLTELKCLRDTADYILVIDNDDTIRCYFPKEHISQLVRKIITRQLKFPERGHWMNYLGLVEFDKTLQKCRSYFINDKLCRQDNYHKLNMLDIASHWDRVAVYWDSISKSPLMHYNRDGSYDAFSAIANTYIDKIEPESVIEIGCGTGSLLQTLPSKIRKYGIDISPNMITLAKLKQIENSEFFVHDIFTIPYPVATAQMILSRGILLCHYGKKNGELLLNLIYKILPKDGLFIFDALLDANDEFAKDKYIYSFDEIHNLAALIGFRMTKLVSESYVLRTHIIAVIK